MGDYDDDDKHVDGDDNHYDHVVCVCVCVCVCVRAILYHDHHLFNMCYAVSFVEVPPKTEIPEQWVGEGRCSEQSISNVAVSSPYQMAVHIKCRIFVTSRRMITALK